MLRQSASKSPFAFHSRVAAREKCWVQTFVWAPRPQLGCRRGMAEAQMLVPGSVLVADAVGNVFIHVELGFAPPRAEAPAGPVRREHARASSTRQSAAPNVAEEPPVAAGRWEPGQARNGISVERLQRAFLAGQFGQQKVQRQIQRVPPTPVFGGPADDKRCFVLLRGRPGARLEGYYEGRYRKFAWYVEEPPAVLHDDVVFHAWASQTDAEEYWRGAGRMQPWPLLSPRRD